MSSNKSKAMTFQQERIAYRRVVQRTIEVFFEKDEQVATELVSRWWEKLRHDPSFKTGLFMHDEPINTAADLVDAERVPPIHEIEKVYRQIIAEAMPHSRSKNKKQVRHSILVADAV